MTDNNATWSYIAHAPRSSVVGQIKGAVGAWFVLTLISGVIALVLNLGEGLAEPVTSQIHLPPIPWWLILTTGFALFLWFMRTRGLEFAKNARSLTRTQCATILAVLAVQFYAWQSLHWLVAISITWALIVAIFSLDRLAADGRAAFEGTQNGDAA